MKFLMLFSVNKEEIMLDIKTWVCEFINALKLTFDKRIWFVGLQGSYARNEATESSDIDMVVILDELSTDDILKYNNMLDSLSHREMICGFISGKNELLKWESSDLFQFYYDTKAIIGSLDELLKQIDNAAVDKAIKSGVCNIYHACVHNLLYEKSVDVLYNLYKSASFTVQAICFKKTGIYYTHLKDLINAADEQEKIIIKTFLFIKSGGEIDFIKMSEILFNWAKMWIVQ